MIKPIVAHLFDVPWSIPVEYAGIRFRSRLEASWAAYFDWIHKLREQAPEWWYEPVTVPFGGGIYTPDLALGAKNQFIIEIKPEGFKDLARYIGRLGACRDYECRVLVVGRPEKHVAWHLENGEFADAGQLFRDAFPRKRVEAALGAVRAARANFQVLGPVLREYGDWSKVA